MNQLLNATSYRTVHIMNVHNKVIYYVVSSQNCKLLKCQYLLRLKIIFTSPMIVIIGSDTYFFVPLYFGNFVIELGLTLLQFLSLFLGRIISFQRLLHRSLVCVLFCLRFLLEEQLLIFILIYLTKYYQWFCEIRNTYH